MAITEKTLQLLMLEIQRISSETGLTLSTESVEVLRALLVASIQESGVVGGGGRTTFTPSQSPFFDDTARDNWASANLSQLFNNSEQVTILVSNGISYEWGGVNTPPSYVNTFWNPRSGNLDLSDITNLRILYNNGGVLGAASIEELPDRVRFSKTIEVPGASVQVGPNILISDAGQEPSFQNLFKNERFLFVNYSWPVGEASTRPSWRKFTDLIRDRVFQGLRDVTRTDTEISFVFPGVVNGVANEYRFDGNSTSDVILRVYFGTSATGDPIIEQNIGVMNGITSVSFIYPLIVEMGDDYFFSFATEDGSNFSLEGSNIMVQGFPNMQFVAYIVADGHDFTEVELLDTESGQEVVAAINTFLSTDMNNDLVNLQISSNILTVTRRNGNDYTLTLPMGGTSPDPSVHEFSINIPRRVRRNTNLNSSRTVNFSITNRNSIQSLELIVSDGDNKTLTLPTSDGPQEQTVILTGIDTSTPKNINFFVRATDVDSGTHDSNTQTVTVRNRLLYWGFSSTTTPTPSEQQNANVVDADTGVSFDISTTVPQNQYLFILTPVSNDVDSITEINFNVLITDTFTRTAKERQIDSDTYNLYVLGPSTGNPSDFRVVLE